MDDVETFEVYAIRYAHHGGRTANEMFVGGDLHEGPMALDYYIWAAIGSSLTYVIDTGFNAKVAENRGRTLLRTVSEGLALINIDSS